MHENADRRPYRRLIGGLAFFELSHVFGLASMLVWLLPGLDPARTIPERAAYVSAHSWQWRLGWLPWQLSAASDVWVTLALISWTRAIHAERARRWMLCSAACLLLAIIPEQYAELHLVTDFATTPAGTWPQSLARYMWLTGTWANTAYTLMTACWLLAIRSLPKDCGQRTDAPRNVNTWTDWIVLLAFAAASVANHLAWNRLSGTENARAFQWASAFNGLAFPGLLWLGVAMSMRIGGWRYWLAGGDPQTLAWPVRDSRLGAFVARLAGSPGLRDLKRSVLQWLPFPTLCSDITDVVYLNWLVDADALEARLPAGARVQRFGRVSVLSVLCYRHGHYGPKFLGALRKLLPSPIQCNVRAYLQSPPGHVIFLHTCIDNPLYFLGSRLLCDGLPAHCAASAIHTRRAHRLDIAIEGGAGSAWTLRASVEETDDQRLPASFAEHFATWQSAVGYLVPQNAALRPLPTIGAWVASSIDVATALDSARPARISQQIEAPALSELTKGAAVFAFVLPGVAFSVRGERICTAPQP